MEKTWIRQPQEQENNFHFNGKILITKGVSEELSQGEILDIILETKKAVAKHAGLDYLQVFKHKDTGQKIFFIDEINQSLILVCTLKMNWHNTMFQRFYFHTNTSVYLYLLITSY